MTDVKEVEPINTKRYDGSVQKDKYEFDRVHTDDVPTDFSQNNVDFKKGKTALKWQYQGKCPILIWPTKVEAKEDAPLEEARNQAYFALSILSDAGYVSRFRKR